MDGIRFTYDTFTRTDRKVTIPMDTFNPSEFADEMNAIINAANVQKLNDKPVKVEKLFYYDKTQDCFVFSMTVYERVEKGKDSDN